MKNVFYFTVIIALCSLLGCNKFKSDHPQAEIPDQHTTDLTANAILAYTASVDKNLHTLEKSTSLVYRLGDLSFYVEKFSNQNQTVVLVEHATNGGVSNRIKKYYFKNDSLVLETINNEIAHEDGSVFKGSRTYLRNNTIFKIENKTASAAAAIKSLPFIDVPLSNTTATDKEYQQNISSLNDVMDANDKFEMVFESITTYPDARYIILRSSVRNSYTASILVKEKDQFIDSLLNYPMQFKDQKLNLKWIIEGNEAVYLPRSSN